MSTSASAVHRGELNLQARRGSDLRLFVDLDRCATGQCPGCEIRCSYFYHPDNNGILSVVELAAYALVCRRCEEPHCVAACPVEALEQQKEKNRLLMRHNMRCVGCRSCSHACPFPITQAIYLITSVTFAWTGGRPAASRCASAAARTAPWP
jgi:Fe-S-cluster-containing dehydrogenase component